MGMKSWILVGRWTFGMPKRAQWDLMESWNGLLRIAVWVGVGANRADILGNVVSRSYRVFFANCELFHELFCELFRELFCELFRELLH